jgi:hypothetical protein
MYYNACPNCILDANLYANSVYAAYVNAGSTGYSLVAWRGYSSQDANSQYSTNVTNSVGVLSPGSPAIGGGMNLTSLGIAALNVDKLGNPRPTIGPWTIGAYQYGTVINPPTGVVAIPN